MRLNRNVQSQRAKFLKMFSFFLLLLYLLFFNHVLPLEAASIRKQRETIIDKFDFGNWSTERIDPDIVYEAIPKTTKWPTTTTTVSAIIKFDKTTTSATKFSNHSESKSVKIFRFSKLGVEVNGSNQVDTNEVGSNGVNQEPKMFKLLETTTTSTATTTNKIPAETAMTAATTTATPKVQYTNTTSVSLGDTQLTTTTPFLSSTIENISTSTETSTSSTKINIEPQAMHSHENSIDESLPKGATPAATAVSTEKRAKFINSNSTNAQQLNLPNNAEVWSLASMKMLPTLNDSGTTPSTELANDIDLQALLHTQLEAHNQSQTYPAANKSLHGVSEKTLHDWQHIMMEKLQASDKSKSYEQEEKLQEKKSQTKYILNSSLETTDIAVTEYKSIAASKLPKLSNETIDNNTTPSQLLENNINNNSNNGISISSLSATTDLAPENSTAADKHEAIATTVPTISVQFQLENYEKPILKLNSTFNKEKTADFVLTTTVKPKAPNTMVELENKLEKVENININNVQLNVEMQRTETKSAEYDDEMNNVTTSLERISSDSSSITVSTPVTNNVSRTVEKTKATTTAAHVEYDNNESEIIKENKIRIKETITTFMPIFVTKDENNIKINVLNEKITTTTEALTISNEINLLRTTDKSQIYEDEKLIETQLNKTNATLYINLDTEATITVPSIIKTTKTTTTPPSASFNGGNEPNELLIATTSTPTTTAITSKQKTSTLASPIHTTAVSSTVAKNEQVVELVTTTTTTPIVEPETTTTAGIGKVHKDVKQQQQHFNPTQIVKNKINENSIETNKISAAHKQDLNLKQEKNNNSNTTTPITELTKPDENVENGKNVQERNANSLADLSENKKKITKVNNNEHETGTDEELSKNTKGMTTLLVESTSYSSNNNINTTSSIPATTALMTEDPIISLLDDNDSSTTTTIATPTSSIATTIEDIYKYINSSLSTTTTTEPVTTTTEPVTTITTLANFNIPFDTTDDIHTDNMLPKFIETTVATATTTISDSSSSRNIIDNFGLSHHPTMSIDNLQSKKNAGETDINIIIAITVIVIGVVAAICLIAFLYIMRKRQKQMSYSQRCRPVSLDAYSLDNVSVLGSVRGKRDARRASKRTYGNAAFDDPALRHNVLNANELAKFVERRSSVFEEFRDVPQILARPDEVPIGCEDKNRYANVIPLPETRVILQRKHDDEKSEYINANFVRGPKDAPNYYIACQAPLDSTVADFWRMIWEQQSRVIIQATDLIENGIEKCAEYLPPSVTLDNHTTYGDYQVTLKHREIKDKYAISTLMLKHTIENKSYELTHYWYKWPETGVPNEEAPVIAMLLEARSSLKSYAIEQANHLKEKPSALTIRSVENGKGAATPTPIQIASGESDSNAFNKSLSSKETPTAGSSNTVFFVSNPEINSNAMKTAARNQGPLTVHCSPGTGRTGTIIACDMAIRSLETPKRSIDIPQIVYFVRRARASAVQTKEQYEFIYRVANVYATKITSILNDN